MVVASIIGVTFVIFQHFFKTNGLPSEVCNAPFRRDDCGMQPVPVMYYWKAGSRCEIGYWRGCLPNINMFESEYECMSACIYAPRVRAEDYHNIKDEVADDLTEDPNDNIDLNDPTAETTFDPSGNSTAGNGTVSDEGAGNSTEPVGNSTTPVPDGANNGTVGNSTVPNNNGTNATVG